MLNTMNLKSFLELNKPQREKEYISFFFKNIANIKLDKPIFEKFYFSKLDNFRVSIIKDTIDRLDNSRHLAQRNSRNCFFCFVEKEKWKELIALVDKEKPFETVKESKIEDEIIRKLHNNFKQHHIGWYIHSYVYIVLVFTDDSVITKDDFTIYYWNTNFTFKKYPNKTEIFGNTRYVKFVDSPNEELQLIESKDKELVDCVNAFKNGAEEFELFELTKEHLNDVSYEIDNGIEYTFIEGPARSGKTILAMLLMNRYSECKLLLMNYTLYNDLKMTFKTLGEEFPEDRIFHHNLSANSGNWLSDYKTLNFVSDFSFLIVDEAQRMSRLGGYINRFGVDYPPFNPFLAIKNIKNHKHTIFLGDNLQRLNIKHDEGFDVIKQHYLDKSFREHKFYLTIGIPKNMLSNILYLLGFNDSKPSDPGEYSINLFDDLDDFINGFNADLSKRKHYVSLAVNYDEDNSFGNETIICPIPKNYRKRFNYLFDEEIMDKYYLTPYEIISREAESIYLYIPNYVDELSYANSKNKKTDSIYHQLYTLMTRAAASLNIYAANDKTKTVLKERINAIKNANESENDEQAFKYDVFIAYHGTNSESGSYQRAKKLCDTLTSSGLSVFLNGYQCDESDRDLGFNETTRIVQKSRMVVAVINDNVPVDGSGMIPRQYGNGGLNQLYQELKTFNDLINIGSRQHKNGFRFLYCGEKTDIDAIYSFLNKYYQELTYGFDCVCLSEDDVLKWALDCKEGF